MNDIYTLTLQSVGLHLQGRVDLSNWCSKQISCFKFIIHLMFNCFNHYHITDSQHGAVADVALLGLPRPHIDSHLTVCDSIFQDCRAP